MAIATNPGPFAGDSFDKDRNRIRRITFCIGSVKTAAHLDNQRSGTTPGYSKVRDDSSDPNNIQTAERPTYITEEA